MTFQQKCLEYVRGRCAKGAGVLFASHNLDQVARECTRAVWLEAGGVRGFGAADCFRSALAKTNRRRTRKRPIPARPDAER